MAKSNDKTANPNTTPTDGQAGAHGPATSSPASVGNGAASARSAATAGAPAPAAAEDVKSRKWTINATDKSGPVPTVNPAVAVVDAVGYCDVAKVAHNYHCRGYAVTWTGSDERYDGSPRKPAVK